MDTNRTADFYNMMRGLYAANFKNVSPMHAASAIAGWHSALKDVSYEDACEALWAFEKTNASGFPPTPGQLLACLSVKTAEKNHVEDVGTQWKRIEKAMRNSAYGYKEEFEKLPPIAKMFVGSAGKLYSYHAISDAQKESERKEFFRFYEDAIKKGTIGLLTGEHDA